MARPMRVAAVVLAVAAGWQYREHLLAAWERADPPPSAARPAVLPDVLYTWVDEQGITHYEQKSGRGQRVTYDGGGITPMARPDPGQLDKLKKAVGEDAPAEGGSGSGIPDLRHELQENARRMQAAKAVQTDF